MCVCVSISVFCLFIDPATTVTYTYGHTLALPDALPSAAVGEHRDVRRRQGQRRNVDAHDRAAADRERQAVPHPDHRVDRPAERVGNRVPHRSEEHTSELQSLMRISYAVFFLKKKTAEETTTRIHTIDHTQTAKLL